MPIRLSVAALLLLVAVAASAGAVPERPAHAAPTGSPSEADQREHSEALTRWIEGNRVLAVHIHVPFQALSAQAAHLVDRIDRLHRSARSPSFAEWADLESMLTGIAVHLRALPVLTDQPAPEVVQAARTLVSALMHEADAAPSEAVARAEWSELRHTLDPLRARAPTSWADATLTRILGEVFERYAPHADAPFAAPTDDERILTRNVIDAFVELTRRTGGPARPAFVSHNLETRFTTLLTALHARAAVRQRIGILVRRYDELHARRERALTPEGALNEAERSFTQKRDHAVSARLAAGIALDRARAGVADGWSRIEPGLNRLRLTVARLGQERGTSASIMPASVRHDLTEAAQALRAAIAPTSPILDRLPGVATTLNTVLDRVTKDDRTPHHIDVLHSVAAAWNVVTNVGSERNLANDARARDAMDLAAQLLLEIAAATAATGTQLRSLNDTFDRIAESIVTVRRALEAERVRRPEFVAADHDLRRAAEALAAIASIRNFEGRSWNPTLPRVTSATRWSLAEASRLRATLMPQAATNRSPEIAPELRQLDPALRNLPMITDCRRPSTSRSG